MVDVIKITDKCKRCQKLLTEKEDVYCTTCLKADETTEEEETQEEKAPEKPAPLVSIFVHETRGPSIIIDDKQGVTPLMALELLLFAVEDLKMNLVAARVAQNIATMSRDEKTFKRLFRGAAKNIPEGKR